MRTQFSKLGQMKIQEMAFMLLAVVLLFALAGIFFLVIIFGDMKGSANVLRKEQAISIAVNLADMPEFSCGKALCIDADRLLVMRDRKDYKGFWPIVSLEVTKVSGDKEKIECNEKNYPNCNYFRVYEDNKENKSVEVTETFVALCRKDKLNDHIYPKCELGRVLVGFEKEQSG